MNTNVKITFTIAILLSIVYLSLIISVKNNIAYIDINSTNSKQCQDECNASFETITNVKNNISLGIALSILMIFGMIAFGYVIYTVSQREIQAIKNLITKSGLTPKRVLQQGKYAIRF